MIYTCSEILLS